MQLTASDTSPRRIFVTGPTGSGKTTLAQRLANRLDLPHHPLDDLHWERLLGGDRRRAPEARAAMLDAVVTQPGGTVEGVQFKWTGAAIAAADLVVVLDPPRWRTMARILRRHLRRRLATPDSPRATLAALRQELAWCGDYYRYERELLRQALAPHLEKVFWHMVERPDLFGA